MISSSCPESVQAQTGNSAIGGITSSTAAQCFDAMVNPTSDLVLIEFSLNDRYSGADPDCNTNHMGFCCAVHELSYNAVHETPAWRRSCFGFECASD